jgi:hypothetical protein
MVKKKRKKLRVPKGIIIVSVIVFVLVVAGVYYNYTFQKELRELEEFEKAQAKETVNSFVCQNAHQNLLCEGLDLNYGQGYREICCSEYNLCC